jgi:hypothetical protein
VQASILAVLPVSLGRKGLLKYSNEGSAAGVVQARAMAHECLEALSMRLGNDLFFGGSKYAGTRTQPCNMRTACKSCNMQIVQHARHATCKSCNTACNVQSAWHATCNMRQAKRATGKTCNVHGMQRARHATCTACNVHGMQHARRATCDACNMRHAGYTLCESTHDHTHGCAWLAHTMCFPPIVPRMSMRSVLQRCTTHCDADRRVLQRI